LVSNTAADERPRVRREATREALIEATAQIMLDEGYAAATSRRVAAILTTTAPAASPNIIAQSDGGSITCRITVDGVVKDERTTDGVNAQTFCLVKSA
jgi:hypothetical protein